MGAGCSGKSSDILNGSLADIPRFKIVLVGDVEVGKTSIFLRYFKNQFDYSYRPTTTVSIENVVKKLNVPENTVVSIAIWDLPGREEVDLRKSYYKDVDAAIVVVNIADPESVELAGTWRQDILNHAVITSKGHAQSTSQIPMLLVGNKFDIIEQRLLSVRENEHLLEKQSEATKPVSLADQKITEDGNAEEEQEQLKNYERANETDISPHAGSAPVGSVDGNGDEVKGQKNMQDDTDWAEEAGQVEEKPDEVLRLEECCNQHGFVGCVAVSAKESDGGVSTAIQALVRHLIERKLEHRAKQKMDAIPVKRTKQRKSKAKKPRLDEYIPLELTEVPQIDNMFAQCNPSMHLIHESKLAYEQSVKHFKRLCLESGIVSGKKSSIEDCIVGLRDSLLKHGLTMMIQEKEGFLEMIVKEEDVIPKDEDESADTKNQLMDVIDTYHSEVWIACKTIINDCPTAVDTLKMQDEGLVKDCSTLLQEYMAHRPQLTAKNANIISEKIDMNRARIKHAQVTLSEKLQEVETLSTKIKAAMMW